MVRLSNLRIRHLASIFDANDYSVFRKGKKRCSYCKMFASSVKSKGALEPKIRKSIKALPEFHVLPQFDAAHHIVICKTFDSK